MNFAIATGGNNQITDLNSPTARNAMAAAINAEARRQLAQQAGKSAVREAQELQRMSQQETTRALPGGVTSSTLPDGYTVLTDAQGKIIGTNRPLSSVVPYAGETVEQARAAINRGESTVADRERLGEALRQSIFQQAPARQPAASQPTGPSSLMSMSKYLRDAYQNAMEAAPGPQVETTPAATQAEMPPAPPTPVPTSPEDQRRLKFLQNKYGVFGTASDEMKALDADRATMMVGRNKLLQEIQNQQETATTGTVNPTQYQRTLSPQEISERVDQLEKLEASIKENYAKSQALGSERQRQIPEEVMQEWLGLRNRAAAATPVEAPSQATGPSSLMSMSRYLRDAYQNAMEAAPGPMSSEQNAAPRTRFLDTLMERRQRGAAETPAPAASQRRFLDTLMERRQRGDAEAAAQQQANIDELLSAIATEFNPTSERLSRERNDDLLRAIGLQHNAASEQLRNARENALIEKQREWNTSRSPADRVRIWEEIQALQNSLGIPNQSASR